MTNKSRWNTAGALAAGLLTAGLLLHSPQGLAADKADKEDGLSDESKIKRGFEIAPVPLNLKGKNHALVGMGSYLVNAAGGCNDCHTWRKTTIPPNFGTNYEPGGDPFAGQPEQIYRAGYLAGGRDFGPFRSRNLTPDASGTVTDGFATFKEIIRHGFDPDHLTPVLQVMPWPVYRNLTDNDLRAIYEYLTTIPCVDGNPGESFAHPDGGPTGRCGN